MFPSKMFSISKSSYSICLLVLSIFLCLRQGTAQVVLSDQAEISILTCSKGDDLYNTFGHTGIRVKDDLNNLDIIFNYGMFSFGGSSWRDQTEFGVKFARGKLEYWLGTQSFQSFMRSYEEQERWVYAQVLNLDPSQKQQLTNALFVNYEPENRAYQYDFFFDNCSSRVRDMIESAVGPVFGEQGAAIYELTDQSFIDLIDPYIVHSPWLDLGMDVMLGLPSSRKASNYEFMFLPYHLKEQFSYAEGLVKEEYMLLDMPDRTIGASSFSWKSPIMLFSLMFIIVAALSYRNWKKSVHWFFLDRLFLFVSGLMGCLFLFMWIGTDHLPAHANLNIFWAFPVNIIALFFVKNNKWQIYFKLIAGLCGFIFLAWFLNPQEYHYSILPLVAMLMIRHLKLADFMDKQIMQ